MVSIALLLFAATLSTFASDLAGRWEGEAEIPGHPLPIVLDLAQPNEKHWSGSITIPGLDVKGAVLGEVTVADGKISGTIRNALSNPRLGVARLEARLTDGELRGDFQQAGLSAPMMLRRVGDAHVEEPRDSTPVGPPFVGEWKGDYEMAGYPRHVTLTLVDHPGAAASAQLSVVGKRTTTPPIDLVINDRGYLTIESSETGIGYEGRLTNDELHGSFHVGGLEVPLTLRRSQTQP